jgi:hypothetical protein
MKSKDEINENIINKLNINNDLPFLNKSKNQISLKKNLNTLCL